MRKTCSKKFTAKRFRPGHIRNYDISINGTEKIFYDLANNEQLKYVSPTIKYAFENYEAILTILAPFNLKELENVDPDKKQTVSIGRTYINKTIMKRAAEGTLNWTLCVFPTDAAAQECGMSKSEYEEFVYSACFLNENDPIAKWRQFEKDQQRIVDYLAGKDKYPLCRERHRHLVFSTGQEMD